MAVQLADLYSRTRDARKIIVVDLGYLGDSIHLTPSLWEIKRNYPKAEVHVASTPLGCELLRMAPCVTRTWPLSRSPRGTPWREQWQWIRNVRSERFDLAFNFSGTDRSIFLTRLSGAPFRVGFEAGRKHFWNRWLIRSWVPRAERNVHVAEQRRRVLAACGLSLGPLRYDFCLPPEAEAWAEKQAPDRALHFSINASHPLKEWPLENWVALARALLREEPGVTLVATSTSQAREQERLKQFAAALPGSRVKIYSGITLAQLAALIARCRLHAGADSGALHLASVLGVPTVSLFREYEGLGEWLPRGEEHRVFVAPCVCVNRKFQPCQQRGHADCLAGIAVEKVRDAIRQLMGCNSRYPDPRWSGIP
jgi:ADP-heptose:LPS heptosyltransferase